MKNVIDHFVIGADSLEQGEEALQKLLGVTVPRGGKHDAMSTHNCVMQSGNRTFLEILSIDPDAPAPGRVRWFSMDEAETQQRLAERPRALCWVVGTDDLDAVVAASPVDLGEVLELSRGGRTWRLTVPRDGHLPEGGLLPAFIEWSPGPHPSEGQQDLGVRLTSIVLTHPQPERLTETLAALGVDHLARVQTGDPAIAFELDSPRGPVVID
ncbi:VOC family protein [Paracoccus seriniphilus]|uniref:Glyoxalase-like domain-containing protein n=1 Tax=Paracoccus seriniphilus TaxID=184748 RepID=A0A239Q234_9RHOB|nr:VOC family protein [Paracoccus seriniphilus]WCR15893.1 VOC family protein [Paracoccus seriniphilus]SNT76316.1 Glyoxalase-like domain-containing protein [Paracoccus seriniphilus]